MIANDFRGVMRRVPTGVTVVTTLLDGRPKGFTANAFASVSADPPMVLICVNRRARSHPAISQAGKFCVNVLKRDQQPIAELFASGAGGDPFETLAYATAPSGLPILTGTLAYFDCHLSQELTAGTHTIFIGDVIACDGSEGAPLGYFDGSYRDFGCQIP